jgi:hypothetical protein
VVAYYELKPARYRLKAEVLVNAARNVSRRMTDEDDLGVGDWLMFYNKERRHASLSRMTPD